MKLKITNRKQLIVLIVVFVIIAGVYLFDVLNTKLSTIGKRELIQLERCVDGDTFVAQTKTFGSTKIRLSGVNTPEVAHPGHDIKEEYFGKEAQTYTCNRLKSAAHLAVEWDKTQTESHERQIAVVFIDEKNFNLELFQEGYANDRYLKDKMPYASEYKRALQQAKASKKGMWAK